MPTAATSANPITNFSSTMPSFTNNNNKLSADKAAEAHADAMPSTENPLLPVYTPRTKPPQQKKQLDPDAALAMLADRYGLGAGAGSFAPVPVVPRSSNSSSTSSFGAALAAKFSSKKSRSVSPPAYQQQQQERPAPAPAARKDYAAAFAQLSSRYGGEKPLATSLA